MAKNKVSFHTNGHKALLLPNETFFISVADVIELQAAQILGVLALCIPNVAIVVANYLVSV